MTLYTDRPKRAKRLDRLAALFVILGVLVITVVFTWAIISLALNSPLIALGVVIGIGATWGLIRLGDKDFPA